MRNSHNDPQGLLFTAVPMFFVDAHLFLIEINTPDPPCFLFFFVDVEFNEPTGSGKSRVSI